ncbi:MAG: TlpA disulfide reductase family protein [Dehalococcoidales bacterium]|nr:TlpA disulfide reductase family protein [Dehalococcoidales bacterium]
MKKIITIILTSILLIASFIIPGCSSNDSKENTAPDFALRGLDGKGVSLSQFKGQPVLLNFWATWCGPCRAEMPYLNDLYLDKEWSDKGLQILAVSSGEPAERVEQFLKENGLSLPVLLDTTQSVSQDFHIQYLPTTFFIDKDGIIKNIKIGAFASKQEIENGLKQIVQ